MSGLGTVLDPELMSKAHKLLNQARMVAEAPAAGTTQIGHSHPSGQMPPGLTFTASGNLMSANTSTLQSFGALINAAIAADSDSELRWAVNRCTAELDALKRSQTRGAESPVEFRDRVCTEYEGQLAGVVARREMTSVTTVRKFRIEDGRDARYGRKL